VLQPFLKKNYAEMRKDLRGWGCEVYLPLQKGADLEDNE
jgi:hypothetical protein